MQYYVSDAYLSLFAHCLHKILHIFLHSNSWGCACNEARLRSCVMNGRRKNKLGTPTIFIMIPLSQKENIICSALVSMVVGDKDSMFVQCDGFFILCRDACENIVFRLWSVWSQYMWEHAYSELSFFGDGTSINIEAKAHWRKDLCYIQALIHFFWMDYHSNISFFKVCKPILKVPLCMKYQSIKGLFGNNILNFVIKFSLCKLVEDSSWLLTDWSTVTISLYEHHCWCWFGIADTRKVHEKRKLF